MPILSDFEYLPSATVDQPKPAPTLLSMTPSSSSISSTFLFSPAHLATEDQPKPEPASTPSITSSSPAILSGPSLPSPSTDDVPKITSMPRCSSEVLPTNFECPPSQIVNQPEFEPKHASLSSITPTPPSLPAPSLALEFTDDVLELFPTLLALQSASLARSEVSMSLSSPTKPLPPESLTSVPARLLPPLRPSLRESCCNVGLKPFTAPANLAPSPLTRTFVLLPVFPASSDLPSASPSSSFVLGPGLESSTVNIAPQSSLELSWSSLCESILLPVSLEAPPIVPISPHSTPSQRPPGLKTVGLVSSPLDSKPAFVLSTPRLGHQAPLIYEALSMLVPHLPLTSPSLLLSHSGFAQLNFALIFITTAALISTLINVSKTISAFVCKLWNKKEDLSGSQNGAFKTSEPCNISAQQLRLGQLTPCASCFVFDPGGSVVAPDLHT
ncbi:hypothetical protein EDB83DRAFT_2532254 [Lactarius deliciosus]|nr:hypothetical protein EDB83DRAFT_2532254 [Lactarius deliciosus]